MGRENMNRRQKRQGYINQIVSRAGESGLISKKALETLREPCVISYTITTKDLTYTKTFPIVQEDFNVQRTVEIGVYATRQVLGASVLYKDGNPKEHEWIKFEKGLLKKRARWGVIQEQRKELRETLLWKGVYFMDKTRDKLVQSILDINNIYLWIRGLK